jgi:hypothetical protein
MARHIPGDRHGCPEQLGTPLICAGGIKWELFLNQVKEGKR